MEGRVFHIQHLKSTLLRFLCFLSKQRGFENFLVRVFKE
jgi:hypothetical protein